FSYNYVSENVPQLFSSSGNVQIAEVIYNTLNEQSRGFGFATMSTNKEDKLWRHTMDINGGSRYY
nr:28 kDa ribonucleoprotein, chloroplastic-like [Tanacetum cinerariifolium]